MSERHPYRKPYIAYIFWLCQRSKQHINATPSSIGYGNKRYEYCSRPWRMGRWIFMEQSNSYLTNEGHNVTAVQIPLNSLGDDIATVKRAIDKVGGPVTLVGHSYGGFVITNAAYNNPNVTGLVYVSAFAPDEGESTATFVDVATLPPGLLVFDSGGFAYLNPEMFHEAFVQDANATEA
ncbi:MAG: alpha/beta hydrolase, partial [Thermoproteota archaeon]|nr:alpha/beta hydrolase [Thermoproteota archaeon]